jgi:hypothetical protein
VSGGEQNTHAYPLANPTNASAQNLIKLERSTGQMQIILDDELSTVLEYWEADPAWDGQLFRSAVQISRQRNKKFIQKTMQLPDIPGNRPINVRWVDQNGVQAQILLEKPAG